MTIHSKKGATLGLIPAVILVMVVIGTALFYFTQFFGGTKELVNATDAGALATARNILSIGLTSAEVSSLPLEFQALGVDNTGTPISIDPTTGNPDLSSAIFNVYAFNRAAGLTLLVALNAAEDGSPSAINNANTLITALNTFGTKLSTDLQNDPSFATAFASLASSNNTTMLGSPTISLGNSDQVQFASVPSDGSGLANIYFNSAIYDHDSVLANWITQTTSTSSITSTINSRYNASDPNAETGQPLVSGYKGLDITAITGVAGFSPVVYACAVNPGQLPHMIDQGRFNNLSAPAACYAPFNSTLAISQASDVRSHVLCSALGCAMLGASDNEYPISMPLGWIRIKNLPDAIAANPAQSPTLPAVPLWINGVNSIFNTELWLGAGGGGGIYLANNGVFCTESYENPNNPFDVGPAGYTGQGELDGWIAYNQSVGVSPNIDAAGHDPRLNPSIAQPDGTYVLGYPSLPTPNMRIGSNEYQLAQLSDMLGVQSIVIYCNSDMYVAGQTPAACTGGNLAMWAGNYQGGTSGLSSGPYDYGTQPVGGLTNLEYLKAEVFGAYWTVAQISLAGMTPTAAECTFTLNPPNLPSGSKVYQRSAQVAYEVPSSELTCAFGTVSSPGALLAQLYNYNASCANVQDNTQWTNITTPLGKLLERCKQILPTVQVADLIVLLNTYPINLNQYQYIYLPLGTTQLAISQTPPIILHPYPEYNSPGSTLPDGTATVTCQDSAWSDAGTYTQGGNFVPVSVSNTVVNTLIGEGGGTSYGDAFTHQQPWDSFTGMLNTYDAVTFTSNSGRNNFLGELSFGNYVNGSSGSYTQPN